MMKQRLLLFVVLVLAAGCAKRVAGLAVVGPQMPNRIGALTVPGPGAEKYHRKPLVNNFSALAGRWNWMGLSVTGCSDQRPDTVLSFPSDERWQWLVEDKSITLSRDGENLRTLPYTWKAGKKQYKITLKINHGHASVPGTFGTTGDRMLMEFYGSFFSEGKLGTGCRETLTFERIYTDH
jgi:hypothetical protein